MRDKALVLLSGGLDSATCLYWATRKFSAVYAITFNYHGRLRNEKRAAAKLAKAAGVADLIQVELPFVREVSDFQGGKFMTGNGDSTGLWSSYVPARNMMFYSIAAHHAEFLGVRWIVGGHNRHDVSFFKDSSKDYIEKMNFLLKRGCLLCNGRAYKIVLPLAGMRRSEIIKLAMRLDAPLALTWSCHKKGRRHCGRCYACRQRLEAFISLGMSDPAIRPA
jgi:7-cyano-7-deazaguanine synthase